MKKFSFTINEKNYLPSTGHFYEFISRSNITWINAKTEAESLNYYGLKGYLATITSAEEAKLSGEQATGQGWIGGSDAEKEGTWKWVTGPEKGKSFWIGGINGTTNGTDINPPYSFWSSNEPNDWPNPGVPGEENYAHVYSDGKWNDYPNSNSSITGYIVEYGGMPEDPIVDFGNNETALTVAEISNPIGDNRCGPGSVSLSATSNSGFVLWFDSLTGGTNIGSGNTYSPTISNTTTYYALASSDGICENGIRTPVIATVHNIPIITSAPDVTICGRGTGTLTATASFGDVKWYSSETSITSINTGSNYSPTITTSTTYYVEAVENGCPSLTRTSVILHVQDTPKPNGISQQTFCNSENATIAYLSITGKTILWYDSALGGTSLDTKTLLENNKTYYASQTITHVKALLDWQLM